MFPFISYGETQVIYDEDNRARVCDLQSDEVYNRSDYLQLSRSICLIVHKSVVGEEAATGGNPVPYPAGGVNLQFYGKLQKLIKDKLHPNLHNNTEPVSNTIKFYDEYVAASGIYNCGTGVIIGQRQILTVDHVFIDDQGNAINPSNFVAIFGWIENGINDINYKNFGPYYYFRLVGYDEYNGESLKQIKIRGSQSRLDLSVVKTDRILDRDIVALNVYQNSNVKQELKGKELFTIGHSLKLPQIFSDNAFCNPNITYDQAKIITDGNLTLPNNPLTNDQYNRLVFANLDGFAVMSGSPIFVKDGNLDWTVVGIYTGGMNDFKIENGAVVEDRYTQQEFNNGTAGEYFQTLQDLKFNRRCTNDCDYIQIQEVIGGSTIKQVRGQQICVNLPSPLPDGVWIVVFNNTVNERVVYENNRPNRSSICRVVKDGSSYNINMYNPQTNQSYQFNQTGTAHGNALGKKAVLENDITENGANPNVINFIPNIRFGAVPLYVSFNPAIPYNYPVSSFYWEFGDGTVGDEMYPTHKYIKPGIYTVKMTAQISGTAYSYQFNNCITVSNEVTSFSNTNQINSDVSISIHDLNTIGQINPTTCIAKDKITIFPETVLKNGTEINIKTK